MIDGLARLGGFGIKIPTKYGGLGLSRAHGRVYGKIERQFQTPGVHETVAVTRGLIAPTIYHTLCNLMVEMAGHTELFDLFFFRELDCHCSFLLVFFLLL